MKYLKLASFSSMLIIATWGGQFLINLEAASANTVIVDEEVTVSGDRNAEALVLYLQFPIVFLPGSKDTRSTTNVSSIALSTISSEEWARIVAADTNSSLDEDWKDWRLTLWGGVVILSDISEILVFNIDDLADSYLVGLAANRPILALNNRVYLEGELQALKHFGDQNHLEFTAGIGIRWQVAKPVSVAFFDGLSIATEIPQIEEERANKTNSLLNYFALEIEVNLAEDWALTGRIHHRSGAFGLFNGVRRGSNGYLLGVSYTF
jgi:hypothetical protein